MSPDAAKSVRILLALTQEELAQHLGVTRGTVARWEGGQRLITSSRAEQLLALLRATLRERRSRALCAERR